MCVSARLSMGTEKGARRLTDFLESVYMFLSRLWDYLTYAFDNLQAAFSYVFDSAQTVITSFSAFPALLSGVLVLSVAVCIVLFVIGR